MERLTFSKSQDLEDNTDNCLLRVGAWLVSAERGRECNLSHGEIERKEAGVFEMAVVKD